MYTYVSATLLEKGVHGIPQPVNISAMLLFNIFANYSAGTIVLTNPSLEGNQYVDLIELQASGLPLTNVAFNTWLGSIGSRTIPASTDAPPEPDPKYVLYQDAFDRGFHVNRISPVIHPSNNPPADMKTDAYIHADYIDNHRLQTKVLTTVNGYLHYSAPYLTGLKITDAGATLDISRKNNIGLLDFTYVGGLEQIRLTANMIKPEVGVAIKSSIIIVLNKDITNKSFLISIGGFLHGEHDICQVLNRQTGVIKILLWKINIIARIVSSYKGINLSSLDLNSTSENDPVLTMENLQRDSTVTNYLQVSQSFVIIVDAPVLYVDWTYPMSGEVFGVYDSDEDPQTPIINEQGRFIPYVRRVEGKIKGYCLTDDEYKIPVYQTADISLEEAIDDSSDVDGRDKAFPRFLKLFKI